MHMFPVYCILFCSIIWPTLLAFVAALQEEEENICDSCRPEWGGGDYLRGMQINWVLQFWGVISGGYLHHSGLWLVLVFRSSDRIYGM